MKNRITAVAALMMLVSPMAYAANSGSITSPQAGAVTSGPGVSDQTTTGSTATTQGTATRQHHAKAGSFQAMDTNHDGMVDQQEWKAAGRKDASFTRIDADHSGTLTQAEVKTYRTAHAQTTRKHSQSAAPTNMGSATSGASQQ
ncbi:hypothetical protein [Azospirillum rugosum]|uniref:Type IV secretory pathway TrbL component n=1 Tax=Azospirillum rugosum TaxID=416170 RepID=A0ABS4SGJ1_9PROT|nr:hypothetical protein [Azospirillum rugosum]MBP2291689.1 type IV secretory pathway TrbL component [Azospirillum rugosum]MDQ0524499.1 type IV secretory pathway TrbL component [Azospirillum rugosum]